MQKDNSVAKKLTTELQKDKSNPEIVSGYFLAIEIIVYLPLQSLYTCDNIEWDQLTVSN